MYRTVFTLLGVFAACAIVQAIQWQRSADADWALNCDFSGNDLISARTRGEECSGRCKSTPDCTHFTWTRNEGGTCWMKKGVIQKDQAVGNNQPGSVCGILNEQGLGSSIGKVEGIEFRKGLLQWADEFESVETFKSNFFFETGGHGWGNNELQFYTDNRNAFIKDSFLTIEARHENYENRQFTSSRIKTHKTFTYGVFEIRAKVPRGRGTWPAFWLLSRKQPFIWPDNGELDILEHVGFDMGRVHANIHTKKYNHMIGTNIGNSIMVDNIDTDFHLYQLEWREDRVTVFVDNKEFFTYRKTEDSFDAWPFDHGYEIILNIAVGGNWGGQRGIDESVFPAQYVIDYVRVYDLA